MIDAREYLAMVPRQHTYTDSARMADALLAVLSLHREDYELGPTGVCRECCEENWPCPTVRAIDEALRRYRNPSDIGDRQCDECGRIGHVHGWIDTLEGGHSVCPGDGANDD